MGKLIIENRSDLTMVQALEYALEIVKKGRISNDFKQYCYYANFEINNKKYCIASFLNKESDRLVIYNESKYNGYEVE